MYLPSINHNVSAAMEVSWKLKSKGEWANVIDNIISVQSFSSQKFQNHWILQDSFPLYVCVEEQKEKLTKCLHIERSQCSVMEHF